MGRRWRLVAVALVLAVAVVGAVVRWWDPVWSTATRWRGSPTRSQPVTTFPPGQGPDLRIAVAGDVGYSGARERATVAAITTLATTDDYDALLLLGDNVYPDGDPSRLDDTVFTPFAPVLDTGTRLLAIAGNHDAAGGYEREQLRALGMPGLWWSTTLPGDVLLVGLDSNRIDDPVQRRWLERTLADATARWRIVALHHPPYSAGYQGSSEAARAAFSPLFERYGVQLVLSGHEHDYQRSELINGVTYVVTGGASDTRRTDRAWFTEVSASWHHFVDLNVFEDRIVLRAVNQDARMFDSVVIDP